MISAGILKSFKAFSQIFFCIVNGNNNGYFHILPPPLFEPSFVIFLKTKHSYISNN